jgi:hypothetical protein
MADYETVADKLRSVFLAPEELADIPDTPRRSYVARDDEKSIIATATGILFYIGASAMAIGVVASGGALATAIAAGVMGGAVTGGIGALAARHIGHERARRLELQLMSGGLILWVRVRTPEHEELAKLILKRNGAEAVRVHDITIQKKLEDLPLSSLRPDPWLGDEHLGDI